MTPLENAEVLLITETYRVTDALRRLTKAVAVRWIASEVNGAAMDLQAAAHRIERIARDLEEREARELKK